MSTILTTHAGSLPRPTDLRELLARRYGGKPVDQGRLASLGEEATRAVVSKQIDVGLDIINNGEVGRESFFTYVQHRMSGFSGTGSRPGFQDMTDFPAFIDYLRRTWFRGDSVSLGTPPSATGEVAYTDTAPLQHELATLQRVLDDLDFQGTAFVTAPSPGIVVTAMKDEHYGDRGVYLQRVAEALAVEYRAILEAGFVLQIDAPDLAMERHVLFQDRPMEEFLRFAGMVVGAINRAVAASDRSRVRLHVCWGNYEGPHHHDVPLEAIWDVVSEAEVGALLLSMANPRHAHEYRQFQRLPLPESLQLVPGVIDTTTNYIEHPEAVADRIERLVDLVGARRIHAAGTDCGFETAAGYGAVVDDIVWAKLGALVEGTRLANRRLGLV